MASGDHVNRKGFVKHVAVSFQNIPTINEFLAVEGFPVYLLMGVSELARL